MSGAWTRVRHLIAVTAALWLLAALPAWLIADRGGLEGLTYALLLCLAPGVIALRYVAADGGPNQALAALVVGMGLRMAFVLAGTLVLRFLRPDLGPSAFHVWVIVGYLVTLAVETRLLLAGMTVTRSASGVGQPTA
ncbi:MAG: hypothetical protein JNG89_03860 [Planctomycetaceae bacterium]|nr:hypothetical protein [Planctomycetaceae bacterium]